MLRFISFIVRDYFGFSRTESRGLLLLLTLVALSVGASIIYQKQEVAGYRQLSNDQEVLMELMQELEARAYQETEKKKEIVAKPEVKRFYFDPNTADVASLISLGIPDYLARRIEKYRSKGGIFTEQESLKKIYGFPDALYRDLAPFIRIAEKKADKPKTSSEHKVFPKPKEPERIAQDNEQAAKEAVPEDIRLNINETDSLALQQLHGIGEVISSRIVKFRDKLGGIHTIDQLEEVFHISEQAMASLRSSAYVEASFEPRKININQADFKTLRSHPYISYEVAQGIINHRRIYGNFTSTDQLKEVYQINEELLVKLLPYLVIY